MTPGIEAAAACAEASGVAPGVAVALVLGSMRVALTSLTAGSPSLVCAPSGTATRTSTASAPPETHSGVVAPWSEDCCSSCVPGSGEESSTASACHFDQPSSVRTRTCTATSASGSPSHCTETMLKSWVRTGPVASCWVSPGSGPTTAELAAARGGADEVAPPFVALGVALALLLVVLGVPFGVLLGVPFAVLLGVACGVLGVLVGVPAGAAPVTAGTASVCDVGTTGFATALAPTTGTTPTPEATTATRPQRTAQRIAQLLPASAALTPAAPRVLVVVLVLALVVALVVALVPGVTRWAG